ncbi:MAG TPA: HAMP domain-containing sensor histidine kinase [Bacteroidales bacterium]|nr:HAMP domain-containing sensor histidine kinase [Bacteroidales bacterium]
MNQFSFNIYQRKKLWKILLFFIGSVIIMLALYYSNKIVKEVAKDERQRVKIWADAIRRKAELVNYTENFFEKIKDEERKRVEIWAEATKRTIYAQDNEDLTFYSNIISGNTTIPVVVTDADGNITTAINIDFNIDTVKKLEGQLKEEFSKYPPIVINVYGIINYLYYKDSKLFIELKNVLNDLTQSFFNEIVFNTASVPVIVTDSTGYNVIAYGNTDSLLMNNAEYVKQMIEEMKSQNAPIIVTLPNKGKQLIYYKDSYILTQLQYYPFVFFTIISAFLVIAYLLFSIARRSEQNQVWVGMARETAHQLGTPISSILAWLEYLKIKNVDEKIINEISKDVNRLEIITERFSKIGSPPLLEQQDLNVIIKHAIDYLKVRTSSKVKFNFIPANQPVWVNINKALFEWVIENLCKNAVDAMNGEGIIEIEIIIVNKFVYLDIKDTGKGIPRRQFKTIFYPGFTTKKRSWGLGLTLSKRIIKNYHKGKIFVKSSVANKGTVFRIVLKRF